jgi:chloramphenicol 3-O phosphotransferase
VSGDIIFLTGASSSGKTSIAKGLQSALTEPFLHVQLDTFVEMLPPHDWPVFARMVDGFHRSISAMADAGNNVIVDHVLVRQDWTEQCANLLAEKYVLFVGVFCPLEELERREALRDSRRQGFAKSQFDFIHAGKAYDLEVDTSLVSIDEAVSMIAGAWNARIGGALQSLTA